MLLFEPRFVSLNLVKENTPNFKIPEKTISASSEDLVRFIKNHFTSKGAPGGFENKTAEYQVIATL